MKTNRPTFKDFKNKALKKPEVREEYEALAPLFAIKKELVAFSFPSVLGGNAYESLNYQNFSSSIKPSIPS